MPHSYRQDNIAKDSRNVSSPLNPLLSYLRTTFQYGPPVGLDFGTFANVLDLNGIKIAFSIDGVGSKIMICELMDQYSLIGIDCVAMNVNDILCVGAKPQSMLDYISAEVIDENTLSQIGQGLADGAKEADINIVGGELAHLPELLSGATTKGAVDLAGTCIGTLIFEDPITGQKIQPGDKIVGLASTGLHSNGFTLARKILNLVTQTPVKTKLAILNKYYPELGKTLGEELLVPTKIYVKQVLSMLDKTEVHGLCHITGDGLLNLPRLDSDVGYVIDSLLDPNPIFKLLAEYDKTPPATMYEVFNMGIGFCLVVPPHEVQKVIDIANTHDTKATQIGFVVEDKNRRVILPELGISGRRGQGFQHKS